ncbi:MAG TPA: anthranilate phosphoribosyltransferase [Parvularcula sp.]|nr:anthranilate phosphoribosyltransferase [Parvularcula sp.]HBS35346.1 anthranilate phosphoribosyltransferase [Parvularcula sp.]
MNEFAPLLAAARSGRALSRDEMRAATGLLLDGAAREEDVAAFLLALKARGETVGEIVAAAEAMRARALKVSAPDDAIDVCGTGGDGAHTYNISTAVAFIVAGCGVAVAKHGNRAASSKSGTADVLQALGVNIETAPAATERAIREAKVGFMWASHHHKAFARVAAVRKKLGVRTIFNALGPLTNPAGARRQLMGVYDRALIEPLAKALGELGARRAWVVAGSDGLDELTTTGPTFVAETNEGAVTSFTVSPEEAGLPRAQPEELKGGDPAANAAALRALLDGAPGAYRDIAILNAAAALIVAGKVATLRDGSALAARSIEEGRAARALADLITISNERRA